MFTLVRNANVYAPAALGKRDILICGGKIIAIAEGLSVASLPNCHEYDAKGRVVIPGFVDGHVHLTGGGGEGGFHTRTPEVNVETLTANGITTVAGLLGTDTLSRHPDALYAKVCGLVQEGVSAFMFTGGYKVPTPTITGAIDRDLAFVDRVIGTKVAISDHRSSQPTVQELARLASETRIGAMMAGKAGIVVVHLGHGEGMLEPLHEVVAQTEIPRRQFMPTHINRNQALLEDAMGWARAGGFIDFTATPSGLGQSKSVPTSEGIAACLKASVPLDAICVSTDGNGSQPRFDANGHFAGIGVAGFDGLLLELKRLVHEFGVPLETALCPITKNPANALGLGNAKGQLREGADADFVVLDDAFDIQQVFAMGRLMVDAGQPIAFGTFSADPRAN